MDKGSFFTIYISELDNKNKNKNTMGYIVGWVALKCKQ